MALTAGQTIALAMEAAHSPGKAQQAQLLYNSILTELCHTYDFAEARGQYLFNFQPTAPPPIGKEGLPDAPDSDVWGAFEWGLGHWGGVAAASEWGKMIWGTGRWGPVPPALPGPAAQTFWPGNQYGSGPYLLPVDYLRLSGSSGSSGQQKSFIWWLQGVPYPVIPMDLAEFDLQVQQAGLQSFVWLSATDMSTPIDDRILLTTTGDVTEGSNIITNLASTTRLIGGGRLGIAGQGIVPGTMLRTVGGGARWGEMTWGQDRWGILGGALGDRMASMSQPANATISGASLIFGWCPVVFIYPPPQSNLQAMVRYQKRMPDVTDMTRYPWFHHDSYMLEKLCGRLCQLNDDDRAAQLLGGPNIPGSPDNKLTQWLAAKDDEPSHTKRVELDRRRFGRGWAGSTQITKRVGW